MNGCNWQNKSFSVGMGGKSQKVCSECGSFDKVDYTVNNSCFCLNCFGKRPSLARRFGLDENDIGIFNTNKDRLYDFVDVHTTGKPIRFTSKRQWKNHLKARGLSDDIPQGKVNGIKERKRESLKEPLKDMLLKNNYERRRISI